MTEFPRASFGVADSKLPNWRLTEDADPDDEQLDETPADVVGMLGFDPAEEDPLAQDEDSPPVKRIEAGGLRIGIETRKGETREGPGWSVVMPCDYGYIMRTEGRDGDRLDAFVGPLRPDGDPVFVLAQTRLDGRFDEFKILLGFQTLVDARRAYDASRSDGTNPQRRLWIRSIPFGELRGWIRDERDRDTKTEVDYHLRADALERCDKCRNWLGFACELVQGSVSRDGWCEMFSSTAHQFSLAEDADFKEEEHPRDESGKFSKNAAGAKAGVEYHEGKYSEHKDNGDFRRPHARAARHFRAALEHYLAGRETEGHASHEEAMRHSKEAERREKRGSLQDRKKHPPEEKKQEEKPPEQKPPEQKPEETKSPEQKPPEQKPPEQKPEETKSRLSSLERHDPAKLELAASKKSKSERSWHEREGVWDHASVRMVRLIRTTRRLGAVTSVQGSGSDVESGSHYNPNTHIVNMRPSVNRSYNSYTFRHEYGHAIDQEGRWSHSSEARREMFEDAENIIKNRPSKSMSSVGTNVPNVDDPSPAGVSRETGINPDSVRGWSGPSVTRRERLTQSIKAGYPVGSVGDLGHDRMSGLLLADYYGAVTKNHVGYGHSDEYYDRDSDLRGNEAFANYIALTEGPHGDVYRTLLAKTTPRLVAAFEKTLDKLAERSSVS